MGNIEIYRNNVCYLLQAPGLLLGWACPSSRPFPTAPSSWGPSSRQSRRSGGRTCGILPLQGQRLLRKAVTVDNRKIQAVFEVDQCQRSICCEADYSAEHRVIDGSTLSIPWYWETIASMICGGGVADVSRILTPKSSRHSCSHQRSLHHILEQKHTGLWSKFLFVLIMLESMEYGCWL